MGFIGSNFRKVYYMDINHTFMYNIRNTTGLLI